MKQKRTLARARTRSNTLIALLVTVLIGMWTVTGCPAPPPGGETTTEGGSESKAETTTEATTETKAEPKAEPATEPKAEPVTEPTPEPTTEPKVEPTVEPTTEPAVEPTTEPTTDAGEPIPEGACQPGESKVCYSGPAGTEGKGICKQGLQVCQPDRTWGSCQGEVLPSKDEICGNKLDDNCDGKTDAEDSATCACNPGATQKCYSGPAGTAGTGACKEGTQTCDSNSAWGACTGEVVPGAQEICGNKIDDNCDGKTDTEDSAACECDPQATRPCYTGPQGTENKGECRAGTQTCKADGKWDVCVGDTTPQNETCDGKDEDCDGTTDNVAAGQSLCQAGQRCNGGSCVCDATSCPNGCCDGNTCVSAVTDAKCGTGGAACTACGQGRTCDQGSCVCNATSCPNGCCDANGQCQTGTSNTACGTGGVACKQCPSGQGCDANSQVCGCGPTTCTTGCCDSSGKCVASTTTACGSGGNACVACDASKANVCNGGTCQCGANPACQAGQRCNGGSCVCDATSCPNGCCDGTTCVTNRTIAKCGGQGGACTACPANVADNCDNGGCRCGNGAVCTGKAKCNNGNCKCDPPSFSDVRINGTAYSNTAIKVAPGSSVTFGAKFRLSQPCSGNCIVQLVVGNYTTGYGAQAYDCSYNSVPSRCPSETTGSKNISFTAPRSPGVYEIRWRQDLQFNCPNATKNFDGANGSNFPIIAKIEVTQPACGSLSNSVYNVSINGGGKEATVAPGSAVTVKADYRIAQLNGCPNCIVQIVAGIVGGATPQGFGCFFNGSAGACPNPRTGNRTLTFTAPTVKGTYHLRWRTDLQFNCTNAQNRFATNAPGRESTFGVLIVK